MSILRSGIAIIGVLAVALLLGGCGGAQDISTLGQGLGGDIGSPYNTPLGAGYRGGQTQADRVIGKGVYPMIECSFSLAGLKGNPFDPTSELVQVTLKRPSGGTANVTAFYDGQSTWRMRYSPTLPGAWSVVSVLVNKQIVHEQNLTPASWNVTGEPGPGFIRIDLANHGAFAFGDGGRFFPLGQDQAWQNTGAPDIPTMFAKMHAAGENWARVWMTEWDGRNLLGESATNKVPAGDIDLPAARKWDAIVQAADKYGIYLQVTIFYHGMFASSGGFSDSSNVNPAWHDNPWNIKTGGFLSRPDAFFTDPTARAYTKRLLSYIVARWGYSPHIMAWELFNEVENTDAAHGKKWDDIAMWHREMALYLRATDPWQHLITTSASPSIPYSSDVWQTVDYAQRHVYAADLITALGSAPPAGFNKPVFVGEFGSTSFSGPAEPALHNGLWASLFSGAAGAACWWDWDAVDKQNLYSTYRAAADFLDASGMLSRGRLTPITANTTTQNLATLAFAPGGGWASASAAASAFTVTPEGPPTGIDRFPSFLQGIGHRDMQPAPLTFKVTYDQPGTCRVTVGQVARSGARLVVAVDGVPVSRSFAPGNADYAPLSKDAVLSAPVPAGSHTITISNTGADWVTLNRIALTHYASALGGEMLATRNYAAGWLYNRADAPAAGKLMLPHLAAGSYRITWWDTSAGKLAGSTDFTAARSAAAQQNVDVPAVSRDVAFYVETRRSAAATASRKAGKRANR
ncbi:MAG: DUF5060 domain-containing protein [Armatimonadetes bacterium]|nr:DUF5060 domain-containing protein [Armatimonadota bacterium]MDE2205376.1 DUF5060 domain-containing protein [Armatimonadota bacterium]